MTLTTLSSKEFKTLYKWAFRRNRTMMIIFSILVGLGLILNAYALSIAGSYDEEAALVTIGVYEVGAAFFTFISALKTFSFLHNKRSVDMFGALPTDRVTLFVSHLLAGVTAVLLPFCAGSVIVMGLATRSGDTFKAGLFMIFTTLLMVLAAYIFTALIAYCCGTIVDTAIVTIAANAIWAGLNALYFGILSEMIPGFSFENIIYTPVLTAFAPYGFSLMDVISYYESSTSVIITNIIWQLIFIVGVFFLTAYVARLRKAESSQNGFAFTWLPMVIKAGASVVAGGFIGYIAAETSDMGYSNMYVFVFWYLIIAVVAYFVLHLIFSRGLHGRFIPQAIVFGSTSIAVIILVFAMTYGLGVDVYVPNPAAVSEVKFEYYTYTQPENIKLITEIHKLITDGIRKEEGYPYFLGYEMNYDRSDYESYEPSTTDSINTEKEYKNVTNCSFDFTYKKKFGFSTQRSYYISGHANSTQKRYYDLEKMDELIGQLHSSVEYKMSLYPELFDDDERKEYTLDGGEVKYMIYFSSYNTEEIAHANLPEDPDFLDKFAEAYKKDVLEDGEIIKYYYNLDLPPRTQYISIELDMRFGHRDSYRKTNEFIVKNTYKNTIALLEKYGITKAAAEAEAHYDSSEDSSNYGLKFDGVEGIYENFGCSGDYLSLCDLVDVISEYLEYTSGEKAGIKDYSEWHEKYYYDYTENLKLKAKELYDKYCADESMFDSGYTNDYIREHGVYGEYFKIEDQILEDLEEYSDTYVASTVKTNEAADSDRNSSDIDTETEKTEKPEQEMSSDTSSDDSETVSKTESMAAVV